MTSVDVVRSALARHPAATALILGVSGMSRAQLEHRAQVMLARERVSERCAAELRARLRGA